MKIEAIEVPEGSYVVAINTGYAAIYPKEVQVVLTGARNVFGSAALLIWGKPFTYTDISSGLIRGEKAKLVRDGQLVEV